MDRPLRLSFVVMLCGALFVSMTRALAADEQTKRVLIVVEGTSSLKNPAIGDGRQLATLLGHFATAVTVRGASDYVARAVEEYDFLFYIGFHPSNPVPSRLADDVLSTGKSVIWLNTGFHELSSRPGAAKRFGFTVSRLDSVSNFNTVRYQKLVFAKGEPNLNLVEIKNRSQVAVLATAVSSTTRREMPYIVRSENLLYVADSPFASAGENDRYLLFADMLHDILNEPHEESHSAIIRIEDINPMESPDKLRDIADILSSRDTPFLVGVIPFYVNPGEGTRVSLSDKPEIVDALHYMVQNGGTIVMHGVTHQYKGVTASDFEFWDESTNGPIKGETAEGISRKLDMGIQEFMKNGLYPLLWETPHYTASFQLYQTVAKYFSTAIEQRLSIEDYDYSQFFPYVIQKDLFGQRIYPENLGYVPLETDPDKNAATIRALLKNAETNLAVRDGFATCFFHAFLDLDFLKEIVDGVQKLGYTYIDLREQTNWVKTKDRVILSGSQDYTVTLDDQYLMEAYYERNGDLIRKAVSDKRVQGNVSRSVTLEPGQFYRAEPTEFRERPTTFVDNVVQNVEKAYERVFTGERPWQEARVAVLWNHYAKGAAFNDQSSMVAVFRSVNINVDTIFIGQTIDPAPYNLVLVPYPFVDSLREEEYGVLTKFVADGGHLVTDTKNDLAEDLGITFSPTRLRVNRIRDRLFPEERINWRYADLANKFEADQIDEVFCTDEATEAPLVIGKPFGKGRLIFLATRFDPQSQLGYSHYPYLLEYVRRYFRLGPVVRREDLEMYFEPGARRTVSIEQSVKQWVGQGIRIVHVAGWHQYPKYTYDYARLISLAHANGILVYVWLEPPQVSQKFWMEHPEWREKNFKGEDVRPSWRYPVALSDKKCLEAMIREYRALLDRFDWDGVNLAELYFEAARGLEDPNLFTPMHPSARDAVRKKYGIDLASIFDPLSPFYWKEHAEVRHAVTEYRVGRLLEVYDALLSMASEYGRAREGFQVIVTALDEIGTPELREYIGADMRALLRLQKQFRFRLQVEDPESQWSTTPLRYLRIGREYEALSGDSANVMLDLNILSFRKPEAVTPFPTLTPTGTESFLLVRAASMAAPGLTIYSESSVNPQDMIFLSFALASGVQYRSAGDVYTLASPRSFALKLPKEVAAVMLDDAPLSPVRENIFVIPAGTHTVRTTTGTAGNLSAYALQPRILAITGNLLSVSYTAREITFGYESSTRTLVCVNREPMHISVDGREHSTTVMKGNDCYSIFLPPGKHDVVLEAGDPFSYGISLTSFWSTTAIAVFGSLAVLLLVGMYCVLVVVRRRMAQE
jgi:uncharacterized protein YdaL